MRRIILVGLLAAAGLQAQFAGTYDIGHKLTGTSPNYHELIRPKLTYLDSIPIIIPRTGATLGNSSHHFKFSYAETAYAYVFYKGFLPVDDSMLVTAHTLAEAIAEVEGGDLSVCFRHYMPTDSLADLWARQLRLVDTAFTKNIIVTGKIFYNSPIPESVGVSYQTLTNALAGKENTISAGDSAKFYAWDKTWRAVLWDFISGKPSSFTPSYHTQPESTITNLISDLAGKAATSHTHAQSQITALAETLATRSLTSHNHNGTYESAISKSTGYAKWTGSAWDWANETYSLSGHNHDLTYLGISAKAASATVSDSGDYNHLANKPSIPLPNDSASVAGTLHTASQWFSDDTMRMVSGNDTLQIDTTQLRYTLNGTRYLDLEPFIWKAMLPSGRPAADKGFYFYTADTSAAAIGATTKAGMTIEIDTVGTNTPAATHSVVLSLGGNSVQDVNDYALRVKNSSGTVIAYINGEGKIWSKDVIWGNYYVYGNSYVGTGGEFRLPATGRIHVYGTTYAGIGFYNNLLVLSCKGNHTSDSTAGLLVDSLSVRAKDPLKTFDFQTGVTGGTVLGDSGNFTGLNSSRIFCNDSLKLPLWNNCPASASAGVMGLDTTGTDTLWVRTQVGWLAIGHD